MLPHVLRPFGDAVGTVVEDHLDEQDVELHLDTPVDGFAGEDRVDAVELASEAVPADVVIVGVGVAPKVVTGAPDHVPLALTANRAGRAIGQTVTGTPTAVGKTASTAVVKAFDLGAARTGVIDEAVARDAGFEPASVEITAPARAHYYPGAEDLTVTLTADRDSGRILGASVVGRKGVKRIDTVATALHADLTVIEVESLDLAEP